MSGQTFPNFHGFVGGSFVILPLVIFLRSFSTALSHARIVRLGFIMRLILVRSKCNKQLVYTSGWVSYWCVREVWKARQNLKSCSRHSRGKLYLLECSPDFASASITRYTHAESMNQLLSYNIANWNWQRKDRKSWWKPKKKSLAKHPRERIWRHYSAQQDCGCTLALVNPIARISWLCYN